jgi:prepilin-type N-terminal cleavage/methylation domain-containing protein
MLRRHKKNEQGFTLVEVIVVAVIVAILAAVAIPLYIGYINDSTNNMCNNEAASFAAALASGKNSGYKAAPTSFGATIDGGLNGITVTWTIANFPTGWAGGQDVTYQVKPGVKFTCTGDGFSSAGTVTATMRGKTGNMPSPY